MPKSLADWATDRPVAAPGPSPGAEALRSAYLGLLKLALCDLAGATTISVGRLEDDQIFSRELPEDQLPLRTNGMDWPLTGLTMGGIVRLDDLQSCVETVIADGIAGDLVEAGAWRGGASLMTRATLDSLGATDRILYVADSFAGFPAPDARFPADEANDLEMFDFLSVPVEEVDGYFRRFGLEAGVELVPGFFHETMPSLANRDWAIVRLDGDTYEATWLTLSALYGTLAVGGYLIVDDYGAFPECRKAVDDFRSAHGIEEPIESVDWTCVKWRRTSDAPVPVELPEPGGPASDRSTGKRSDRLPVSVREMELEAHLAAGRARIAELELELEALRGTRAVRVATRLRSVLGSGAPEGNETKGEGA